MEHKDYPEAPKAIRVIAGFVIALSVIMMFWTCSLTSDSGGMDGEIFLALLLIGAQVVLMVYLYRNSLIAAYLFIGLKVIDVILNIMEKDIIGIIISLIIGIIVVANLDGMKLAQNWFDNHKDDDHSQDNIATLAFLAQEDDPKEPAK
jgi:hypothetical protein